MLLKRKGYLSGQWQPIRASRKAESCNRGSWNTRCQSKAPSVADRSGNGSEDRGMDT